MEITEELCELVGAILGDGDIWTDGSRSRIEMTGNPYLDKEYFKHLASLEENIFGKKPSDIVVRSGALRLYLRHKPAFLVLRDLGLHIGKGKALNAMIPKQIMEKGWKYVRNVIRGVADTDGTVFFSKKTYTEAIYPTLEISTISTFLATQINDQLQSQGFRVRTRVFQKGQYYPEHKVALYGHEMLMKWINEIGFSNSRHINKLISHNLIRLITPQ